MKCKKCGAEISDENAKTCPNCGAPTSKSIKINSKKTIMVIVALIVIGLCCSFLFLQQATLTSQIESELGGHCTGNEGTDFKIKANVTHENIFGAIIIDDEEVNVTVKDNTGKEIKKITVRENESHDLGNLSVGHYTLELTYAGNFPKANSTMDISVISAEDYAKKHPNK